MTFNCLKIGRAVTFMKHLAGVVSLISLTKTLIFNKITFPASNCRAGGKSVYEEYLQNNLPIFLFLFDLSLLNVKIPRAYN